MKIIIPIKQVPETKSVKMDEKTGTVIREGVAAIINPLDLYAIELAIQLKERYGGTATAISMGPPKASEALREAVAMGVDEGVLISDQSFAGSDTWSTAYILAKAVGKIGAFDLIICGERATDGDTGQVGPEIAAYLKLPIASYVNKFKEISNSSCLLHRMTEEGDQVLSVNLPALITVVKEVSEPRLPTFRGKLRAREVQIPVMTLKDLAIDSSMIGLKGSPTKVVKIFRPKVARECDKILARDEEQIEKASEKFLSILKSSGRGGTRPSTLGLG